MHHIPLRTMICKIVSLLRYMVGKCMIDQLLKSLMGCCTATNSRTTRCISMPRIAPHNSPQPSTAENGTSGAIQSSTAVGPITKEYLQNYIATPTNCSNLWSLMEPTADSDKDDRVIARKLFSNYKRTCCR